MSEADAQIRRWRRQKRAARVRAQPGKAEGSQKLELVRLLYWDKGSDLSLSQSVKIADAILAAGYRKQDPAAIRNQALDDAAKVADEVQGHHSGSDRAR